MRYFAAFVHAPADAMTSYVVFLGMSLALILVPGPSQALTIAQTLAHGRRAGILVALGLNTGTLVHVGAAAAGLSALLATSDLAFAIVKYAGAAYLLYQDRRRYAGGNLNASPCPGNG